MYKIITGTKVRVNSLIVQVNAGSYDLIGYPRGALFIVKNLSRSSFNLIAGTKQYSGIGRSMSDNSVRFRFAYKNEAKLCI